MMNDQMRWFAQRRAVLVTMHGKEHVIGPVLTRALGLEVVAVDSIDTDQFGTFTGEIPRHDSQLQTAIAKATAGMMALGCDLGIASEGSFGPHADVPWLTVNREVVVLVDGRHGWVIEGWAASSDTVAIRADVHTWAEAKHFSERVGFPAQGIVVRDSGVDASHVVKNIDTHAQLSAVLTALWQAGATVCLEADLRAHRNPKRRTVIAQATEQLIGNAMRTCPACDAPGLRVVEIIAGLVCEWCGTPTHLPKAEVYRCVRCVYRIESPTSDGRTVASPEFCGVCNP